MQEKKQEKSLIKQNILRYLENKGVTPYIFYKQSGVTRGVLSQPNGISEDNLFKFLSYAPDVNVEWLLTGNGALLMGDARNLVVSSRQEISSDDIPSEVHPSEKKSTVGAPDAATLMALLHDKDATIRQLSEQIGILKERIRGIERNKAKTASPALDTPDALIG